MAGNANLPGASVSSRLFAVLDCFEVSQSALTLTDIATRSALPLSTARRLVKDLTAWGGLVQLPDRRYCIGIHLWKIGSLAYEQRDFREAAMPYLHDLYEATLENVQLAVLDGLNALCVEKISGTRAVPTQTEVGGRLPLHATGVGKVLLAFSPPEVVMASISHGLRRLTCHTIVERGRLMSSLAEVRRTGVAYSREEMTLGAVSVAAAVKGPDGLLKGAVSIVTRSNTQLDRLEPAVRTAALGISRTST
ncbi:IclR family transcriptional regulator [Streptomyces sp. NBC_01334]|uniref:IclR family transcriptional regulator n=1 Tax=Streptomyces sp. NBC_01334 TaxID=2903827 RepID=UPI002E14F448|nr:IclR family transcriptional regulator [Streptomyces sp. NBC_01334]